MIPNFEDLCLMRFVVLDDHYRALPPALKPRGEQAECSDSELLTMRVVSKCVGWHRETEHVSQWGRYRDLFPAQPDPHAVESSSPCPDCHPACPALPGACRPHPGPHPAMRRRLAARAGDGLSPGTRGR